MVVAIVALASAVVTLALPDPAATRLEREAARLAAILETARVQARASGTLASWVPGADPARPEIAGLDFHFEGLPPGHELPERWSDADLSDRIVVQLPARQRALVLGPEPVIPAQRLVLQLDDRRVVLATDGLAPFAVIADAPEGGDAR